MIREQLADRLPGEPGFRWRGEETTRLEGFTDAVFAFAVTLLVVSLEVPKTYEELMASLHGFFAFGLCFLALTRVWLQHYRYFRRYALQDGWSIFLNCLLLFFVLFYVYPLKYLITGLFDGRFNTETPQARSLIIIFGLGFAAVHVVFGLLYLHAYRLKAALQLTPIERLRTLHGLVINIVITVVGLASAGEAALSSPANASYGGYLYLVLPGLFVLARRYFDRREQRFRAAAAT